MSIFGRPATVTGLAFYWGAHMPSPHPNKGQHRKESKMSNFQATQLSVLAYANNFTLWHYNATSHDGTELPEGFFDGARDMLRRGDRVLVSAPDNRTYDLNIIENEGSGVKFEWAAPKTPEQKNEAA